MTVLCLLFGFFYASCVPQTHAQSVSEKRAQLERELAQLEKEIDAQKTILTQRQNQRVSLERDLAILTAQINEAKLSIKARNLTIQGLSEDIRGKQKTINVLSDTIEKEKDSIAHLLQKKQQLQSIDAIHAFIGGKNIAEYFADVDSFAAINDQIQESYNIVSENRKQTQTQKDILEDKKDEQTKLLAIQQLQQRRLQDQEKEKANLIKITKGEEVTYQKILKQKQQSAADIRTALFQLSGSSAIPFEQALQYAKLASAKTGVRPAVILGIITEESNLGQNVGKGTWRVDMHPTRDQPIFAELMKHLGLDPDQMPVSKKVWYGYGGAMGPAQFIPSTWILYAGYTCTKGGSVTCTYDPSADRIGSLTGKQPPNPWDPATAFMASALLMKENGAAAGTRSAERLAALRYLAGWTNATKAAYAFYGDDVMRFADKYQKQIDILGL